MRSLLVKMSVLGLCAGGVLTCPNAVAAESRGITIPPFYDPPASLPASPGTLLRSEPMPLSLDLPYVFPGSSTRIMYTTIDSSGAPVAVTGAYIRSRVAWRGQGDRPVIAFASGTIGQGDQCAPSLGLEHPINLGLGKSSATLSITYDILQMSKLLNAGYDIALTDYVGLGVTDRVHTYVNRIDSGHALLDVVRAARQLGDSRVSARTRVAIWGYSEGGGAAASAAELQSSYAPDVNVIGAYAGAPPADLIASLSSIDNGLGTGVVAYTINGSFQSYPEFKETVYSILNPKGLSALNRLSTSCLADAAIEDGFTRTAEWTKSGKSLLQEIQARPDFLAAIEKQRIGTIKPRVPVLVTTDLADNTVPHKQVRQLAVDWCGRGAEVLYRPLGTPPLPGDTDRLALHHAAGIIESLPHALTWLSQLVAGEPHKTNCSGLSRLG